MKLTRTKYCTVDVKQIDRSRCSRNINLWRLSPNNCLFIAFAEKYHNIFVMNLVKNNPLMVQIDLYEVCLGKWWKQLPTDWLSNATPQKVCARIFTWTYLDLLWYDDDIDFISVGVAGFEWKWGPTSYLLLLQLLKYFRYGALNIGP